MIHHEDCYYDFCPESPDGRHRPDPHTVAAADGYDADEEGGVVLDITCKECGCCGAFLLKHEDVKW